VFRCTRREVKRHAAFGSNRSYGKRCRRCALPPQSKSWPSVREVAGLDHGWKTNFSNANKFDNQ
jgi:hypothetical protein